MDTPPPPNQEATATEDRTAVQRASPPSPPPETQAPPQEAHPSTEPPSPPDHPNPLTFPPNPRPPSDNFLLTRPWLLALLPPLLLWFPFTALPLGAAVAVYHYLLHEARFHASLVRATPPHPEAGLPGGRGEWVGSGGLVEVEVEKGGGECVVCRGEWEDPVKCTRRLWRLDASSLGHLRELERLAKATAAISLIAFPTTLLANATFILHICTLPPPQRTISRWIMLLALLSTSALILTIMFQGFQFMFARRRTHGTGWWGRELGDEEESEAWRMALCTLSLVAGVWLVQVCVVGEEFGRGMAPGWLEWRVWMVWRGTWGWWG